jgi:hypothetical protein
MTSHWRVGARLAGVALIMFVASLPISAAESVPRSPDGRPNLEGIWQAGGNTASDVGGSIPYQPWAVEKKAQNFKERRTADPLANCYLPGVPRLMYLAHPFQIFQTPSVVAVTFSWAYDFRIIYTDGSTPPPGIDFWLGDSRGHWDGDTLVVDVTNHNDKTWFDKAGNFHSDQLHVIERYTLTSADTIQYVATIQDPKVFTKEWTIRVPLHRQKQLDRLPEYHCNVEAEEKSGAFERNPRTWYPKP